MKQREELNKVQMDEHSQTYMHKIVNTNLNKTHQFEWTKHQQPVKKKKKKINQCVEHRRIQTQGQTKWARPAIDL